MIKFIICFLLMASGLRAEPLAELSHVAYFCVGGVGFGGDISEGEVNFRKLYSQKNNLEQFIRLYGIGNDAAQMYAMAAFHKLAPDVYLHIKNNYKGKRIRIRTQFGCIESEDYLAELLQNLEAGRYDNLFEPRR